MFGSQEFELISADLTIVFNAMVAVQELLVIEKEPQAQDALNHVNEMLLNRCRVLNAELAKAASGERDVIRAAVRMRNDHGDDLSDIPF